MLALRWAESVDFEVKPFSSRGFGSTLVQTVSQQSGGSAELNLSPSGITWDVSLDLGSPVDESYLTAKHFRTVRRALKRSEYL
jgi:two-component sensor histidine kinase